MVVKSQEIGNAGVIPDSTLQMDNQENINKKSRIIYR